MKQEVDFKDNTTYQNQRLGVMTFKVGAFGATYISPFLPITYILDTTGP